MFGIRQFRCRVLYPSGTRVQHFNADLVCRQVAAKVCLSGQAAAMLHGADGMCDGVATDAGTSAVINIANTIAALRQIETSSNTIVRMLVAARGMLMSLQTSMGEPPVWAGGNTAAGLYQLGQRRP